MLELERYSLSQLRAELKETAEQAERLSRALADLEILQTSMVSHGPAGMPAPSETRTGIPNPRRRQKRSVDAKGA
jgi:hypothetical protein